MGIFDDNFEHTTAVYNLRKHLKAMVVHVRMWRRISLWSVRPPRQEGQLLRAAVYRCHFLSCAS